MFSRDYDQQWIRDDIRTMPDPKPAKTWGTCPRCKAVLHIGPNGLYCERATCEWEQGDKP